MVFLLDQKLQADCIKLGELKLSRLLLMNDSQYPWLILVPRCTTAIHEVHELNDSDRRSLMDESNRVALALQEIYKPDKLNIAAIGNIVSQLHIHHVARFKNDIAWPAPVWGAKPRIAYDQDKLQNTCAVIKNHFNL
ncbi:MAG: HIT domain-containing protein [Francisellaceae bacterium]|nr:HIT domain-containing protein [Francisellaceae bacterium]